MKESSDAALVALARVGQKEAFGQLIERYDGLARRVASRLVSDPEIARELVQEAFLEAYLSLEHLREPQYFKSWLCGIVLNLCRNYCRSQKISVYSLENLGESLSFQNFPFGEAAPDPHEIAEARELHRQVLEAVKLLSPQNRAATLLFYFRQLSLQEIAAILGISVVAVKGRLHKARHQLRELLQPVVEPVPPKQISTRRKIMVKVTVADVVKQPAPENAYSHTALILLDEAGRRIVPIWVGHFEGEAIAIGLRDFATPRPMTFNFMAKLLEAAGASLEEVRIENLKDETYYAVAKIRAGDKVQEIDARPSDAIALALRTGAPLFVAEEIFESAGVAVPADLDATSPGKGLDDVIQEVAARYQKPLKDFLQKSPAELENSKEELIKFVFGGLD